MLRDSAAIAFSERRWCHYWPEKGRSPHIRMGQSALKVTENTSLRGKSHRLQACGLEGGMLPCCHITNIYICGLKKDLVIGNRLHGFLANAGHLRLHAARSHVTRLRPKIMRSVKDSGPQSQPHGFESQKR